MVAPNRNTIIAIIEPSSTINHVCVTISFEKSWLIGYLRQR